MTSMKDRLLAAFMAERPAMMRRLTRRTGSPASAEDILQDLWLRIAGHGRLPDIDNPAAYLRRSAANLAIDQQRADQARRLAPDEIEALLFIESEAPDPEQTAAAREDMAALHAALAELPARRRAIFVAARVEERPHREIAARFGVTTRTVDVEIRKALDHCAARLGRKGRRL